ncbi:ATP-dependent DNA helicase RecG [Candidatus Methylopumilus universalis]|uniref:ATP-dependent DNA helicase RecG n=1 Tax=Candidatus Methylopumilus universalis TaxID=2588536 RepID=UPI00111D97F7|nr:ATP-dependent DNA helicase RecG [Candidatus Methylopumilus universalis]QDC45492.1 ATP-dependent DNA helicase RecG [Candidatus Methylopumilus universalis]
MTSLAELKLFTPSVLNKLKKLGVEDVFSLAMHLPIRYIDETIVTPIHDIQMGELSQIEAEVIRAEIVYKPKKMLIVQVKDASGSLQLRFLHFYPSQMKMFEAGNRIRILGEARHNLFAFEMIHPQCKLIRDSDVLPQSLTPIYSLVAGVGQKTVKDAIDKLFHHFDLKTYLKDLFLPFIYEKLHLPNLYESLESIHHPKDFKEVASHETFTSKPYQRIIFDEFLAQQLSLRSNYLIRRARTASSFKAKNKLTTIFMDKLEFELTGAQKKVIQEIKNDLEKNYPMQRLLQGDVGSGKTVVATIAALQVIENGSQVAFMAPTEILAEQHYRKLYEWLTPLDIEVAWLTGSQSKKDREISLKMTQSGEAHIVVGTHALFQEHVIFKKLGLSIIDEQHRFGVEQRLALRKKGQLDKVIEPHQLMMSATPIPRTLSMSYFADLDVSIIDELPKGREAIVTKLFSEDRRDEILKRVHEVCHTGAQVYWVCPLIEESEVLQLQTAEETYLNMQSHFQDLKVGLVHGRMKSSEKQKVMSDFVKGDIQLLVATTVIEVGVDVPNATLMVIENAERMGLSQLHQLRGRVGRGSLKSTCILLFQKKLSELARQRLKVIFENTDGFVIAQEDLNIRGPGEFLGVRQSGVPMLRIANLNRDFKLLEEAKAIADQLLEDNPEASHLHLKRWLSHANERVKV